MGFGLPSAMGALVGLPDASVVCITGESSIQMNIQELSTCKQYGLPSKSSISTINRLEWLSSGRTCSMRKAFPQLHGFAA